VPSAVVFEQQPSDAAIGTPITPAVVVRVHDASNNGVSGTMVTLGLTGGGTLAGSAAVATDSTGRATVPGLSVDQAGVKHLVATSGPLLPVASTTFTVKLAIVTHVSPVVPLTDSLGGAGSSSMMVSGAQADSSTSAGATRLGGFAPRLTPNPMRTSASLGFGLERPGTVQIRVFDLEGRLVRTLPVMRQMNAGWNVVALDGRRDDGAPLNSGVYLYEVRAGEQRAVGRFVVIR
jgi:hypothetical protein